MPKGETHWPKADKTAEPKAELLSSCSAEQPGCRSAGGAFPGASPVLSCPVMPCHAILISSRPIFTATSHPISSRFSSRRPEIVAEKPCMCLVWLLQIPCRRAPEQLPDKEGSAGRNVSRQLASRRTNSTRTASRIRTPTSDDAEHGVIVWPAQTASKHVSQPSSQQPSQPAAHDEAAANSAAVPFQPVETMLKRKA